jgi:aspartyl-tRNA(Asn)/glutamyl-tRNA(Gln) amidotransferase subunit A
VTLAGILPLAPSLDSAGPLARSVADCAIVDGFMAGEENPAPPAPLSVKGLRLGLPRGTYLTDGMDATVGAVFSRTLTRLSAAGAHIIEFDLPELAEIPVANAPGGFAASEAWAWHHGLIAEHMSAADYVELVNARARIIAAAAPRTAPFDAVVCPTCPIVPPRISEVEDEREYNRINMALLRNTSVGNFLDRCSISIPCHAGGEAPVGLMLTGEHMGDARLFAVATAGGARVERIASRAVSNGEWYDQTWPEFVLLVEGGATLAFEDGSLRVLRPGDWAFLPAHCRHRVAATDPDRETLWLAVHLPAG